MVHFFFLQGYIHISWEFFFSQKFDAVVGDTTIMDYRTEFVDFTLPYSDSGLSMLVLAKPDERNSMWIFLWPLHWDLWLVIALGFIYTGLVLCVLERRQLPVFKGSLSELFADVFSLGISTLSFPPGTLLFPISCLSLFFFFGTNPDYHSRWLEF